MLMKCFTIIMEGKMTNFAVVLTVIEDIKENNNWIRSFRNITIKKNISNPDILENIDISAYGDFTMEYACFPLNIFLVKMNELTIDGNYIEKEVQAANENIMPENILVNNWWDGKNKFGYAA